MAALKLLYESGDVSAEDVAKSLEGWLAYAKQGNTFKLRKTLVEKYGKMFGITFPLTPHGVSSRGRRS
jgi:hypothetical protein